MAAVGLPSHLAKEVDHRIEHQDDQLVVARNSHATMEIGIGVMEVILGLRGRSSFKSMMSSTQKLKIRTAATFRRQPGTNDLDPTPKFQQLSGFDLVGVNGVLKELSNVIGCRPGDGM